MVLTTESQLLTAILQLRRNLILHGSEAKQGHVAPLVGVVMLFVQVVFVPQDG